MRKPVINKQGLKILIKLINDKYDIATATNIATCNGFLEYNADFPNNKFSAASIPGSSSANTPTNSSTWKILQLKETDQYGVQIAMHADGNDIYFRRKYFTTWYDWQLIPTAWNITPRGYVQVRADGVKNYQRLMYDIAQQFDLTKLACTATLQIGAVFYNIGSVHTNGCTMSMCYDNGTDAEIRQLNFDKNTLANNKYRVYRMTPSSGTITAADYSNAVSTNGNIFTFRY